MASGSDPSSDMNTESPRPGREFFDIILIAVREDKPDRVRKGIRDLNSTLDRVEKEPATDIYQHDLLTRSSLVGYLLHTSFAEAAALGLDRCLEVFLEEGVPVDQTAVRERDTVLMIAARRGHTDSVKLLLARGANVNAHNTAHETAMFHAANPEIMQVLYDNGADVNVENCRQATALFHVVMVPSNRTEDDGFYPRLCWLLDHGAMLNHKDGDGATALIHACQRGAMKSVRALILAGARVDISDTTNMHTKYNGLLSSAIFSKSIDMVKLILSLVPSELLREWAKDSRIIDSPLNVFNGHDEKCLEMIKFFVDQGWSLTGNFERVIFPGNTHLHFFRHPLHHVSSNDRPIIMDFFLDLYESRSLSVDCDGLFTPLHQACQSKAPYAVQQLLRHGADLTIRDQQEKLPLLATLDGTWFELRGRLLAREVIPFGASFTCFSTLLRHADPYYLNIPDLTTILLMSEDIIKYNHPVADKNVQFMSHIMLMYVAALYASCSVKHFIRGLLSQRKLVRASVTTTPQMYMYYSLHDNEKYEYIMTPALLRLAARDVIRRRLRTNIPEKIKQLPLPGFLQKYMNLPELDDLLEEYLNHDYQIDPLM